MAAQANGPQRAGGRRIARRIRLGASVSLICLAMACSPIYRNHGYAPTDAELSSVEVGRDTRETVTEAVGRPSANGVLGDGRWYYVQSRYRQGGVRAPREIDRQVVVITFAEGGTVSNVERFGLEQGRVVALSRRVTETNIEGVTFIGQLLSNVGRVSAEDLIQ